MYEISRVENNPDRTKARDALRSAFFDTPLVDVCTFLEEINVKEPSEKDKFFAKLPSHIGSEDGAED